MEWLYNPQIRNGCCPKLSSDWEGLYTVVTRINDVVYRIRLGSKRKMKIVHFGRHMKYNSSAVDVSDREEGAVLRNKPIRRPVTRPMGSCMYVADASLSATTVGEEAGSEWALQRSREAVT